ncbi:MULTISPECIES: CapA family protein [unclassified Paenibacillus]|uniref:CapA family protein n=1 Tax=unclassified Paenibacillus TaxID=185978 RepID=UPI001AE3EA0E|nr:MULTISPECIES: CapA family protein [unclassified Paenibacillus]MBP1154991.1 poly-gamma-glutamate synthesis protein (capsule biosynthesis protein) [Paenibacillus sp. PvP091]MBP1169625.1 poly-gamma-glutamate synthesis protein (capsule biosynthesis protein) [Paenibacillus sp. PvR098]MBP2440653.1 poly-gamma-glutamate synthesis protein (capsule biosynthesis protein) [Paenibacillus sp. PvP052]
MTEIRIAAVGDLMVKRYIISDAKASNGGRYSFDRLFSKVAPYLKQADVTIGNLETTFAGKIRPVGLRNKKTGCPLFSCPDELAPALHKAGFDVVTTANNHCMDTGTAGLSRTLRILDQHGIRHTGTFRSSTESRKFLIMNVKGIKIGILSYTKGTNGIPVPSNKPWMVNRMGSRKIIRDIRHLKTKVDLVIIYLHFGREYQTIPNKEQKRLVSLLFKHGAHIILGSHPHVLQPMAVRGNRKFVIYSLGNFVSTRLKNNPLTQSSIILNIDVKKASDGKTIIKGVHYLPVWVRRSIDGNRKITEVIPNRSKEDLSLPPKESRLMKRMLNHTRKIIKRSGVKAESHG